MCNEVSRAAQERSLVAPCPRQAAHLAVLLSHAQPGLAPLSLHRLHLIFRRRAKVVTLRSLLAPPTRAERRRRTGRTAAELGDKGVGARSSMRIQSAMSRDELALYTQKLRVRRMQARSGRSAQSQLSEGSARRAREAKRETSRQPHSRVASCLQVRGAWRLCQLEITGEAQGEGGEDAPCCSSSSSGSGGASEAGYAGASGQVAAQIVSRHVVHRLAKLNGHPSEARGEILREGERG